MTSAILLMAHGTPSSLDEMPEYLRLVRGGRPPSDELVEEMRHNYGAIGGRSPLTDITLAQADALQRRLGGQVPVAVGMRNWKPFIKDALAELAGRGIDRVVGVPMAPQFSTLSVQKYVDAATAVLPAGLRFEAVTSYHSHPLLLQAFAERVRDAAVSEELVIFTAHSLPKRVIEAGDVYADEVAATARGVAALAGIARFEIAYQSAGRTPEPWIGPDLSELITARVAAGTRSFLVVPVGFVCDHTEILFDIDVQAARTAADAGATLRRTESLNTSPTYYRATLDSHRAGQRDRLDGLSWPDLPDLPDPPVPPVPPVLPVLPVLPMSVDVIVVGGGIAGLSAAYELHARGLSFALLERTSRPGGVIVSEEVDGYTIDGGPDALLVQKPEAIALCREIGLGDRLVPTKPPRLAFIQRGGKLHALPSSSVLGIPTRLGPFVRTGLFSWAGKVRMAAELFVPARKDGADESIGSFMRRRFGDEATTYLAEPLLAGIHAGDVDRLSIRALFPRLVETERQHGSLLGAFRRDRPASVSPDGAFRSLPGGLSEMVRALVGRLPQDSLKFDTPVRRVLLDPPRVETGGAEPIAGRAVIVTAPAYVAADLVHDVSTDLARLCSEVPYASTATVALAFPRAAVAHPLNGSGFVVPRTERTGILAASWLSSKWPHRAPDDRVLMRAFVGGARDPGALDRSDADLVAVALSALGPLLGISSDPLMTRVYRFERASAQHEVGHLARVEAIDRALAQTSGLFMTGSGLRGVGIPDCVADARATARKVSEWLGQTA